MGNIFYCVGYCPVCETGPLGARICGACGHAWVQCDECEALWADPDLNRVKRPERVAEGGEVRSDDDSDSSADLPCPSCGSSLWAPPSHWASLDELERLGWHDRVVAQGLALPDAATDSDTDERNPWARPAAGKQGKRSSRKRRGRHRPDGNH